jgi:DNA-directed RNA polymerase subunit RPC12/RpoP
MRCKKCSTTWKLSGSDDGPLGKAAPGHFMIIFAILLLVALVLGLIFKSIGGLAIGLLTVFFLAMALVGCGRKEKAGTYPGSNCPECGHENRIMPWHF